MNGEMMDGVVLFLREIDGCQAGLVLRASLLLEICNARSRFDPPIYLLCLLCDCK